MLLVAALITVFVVSLPLALLVVARRGRRSRIASGLVAIVAGIGFGAVAFVPASNLPDLPLLGAAVELLLLAALPLSDVLLVLYPLGLIGLGAFLLFRALSRNSHAAESASS